MDKLNRSCPNPQRYDYNEMKIKSYNFKELD